MYVPHMQICDFIQQSFCPLEQGSLQLRRNASKDVPHLGKTHLLVQDSLTLFLYKLRAAKDSVESLWQSLYLRLSDVVDIIDAQGQNDWY